jgi:hypothetical protein
MKFGALIIAFILITNSCSNSNNNMEIGNTISDSLEAIQKDLINIKDKYNQLSDIENSKIENFTLTYEKGFLGDSKIDGPSYGKYGTDILIKIHYPADGSDRNQLESSPYIKLKDGKYLVFRISVRSENNENGIKFKQIVDNIVYNRIRTMLNYIESNPKEHKMVIK